MRKSIMTRGLMAAALAVSVFTTSPVLAGGHAAAEGSAELTGVYKDRSEAMKSLGADIKALSDMLFGQTEYDAAKALEASQGINAVASTDVAALFPEGSLEPPTEALPIIWEEWDEFKGILGQFATDAAALEAAAADGTDTKAAVQGAFMAVGGACQTCHKKFRAEES